MTVFILLKKRAKQTKTFIQSVSRSYLLTAIIQRFHTVIMASNSKDQHTYSLIASLVFVESDCIQFDYIHCKCCLPLYTLYKLQSSPQSVQYYQCTLYIQCTLLSPSPHYIIKCVKQTPGKHTYMPPSTNQNSCLCSLAIKSMR